MTHNWFTGYEICRLLKIYYHITSAANLIFTGCRQLILSDGTSVNIFYAVKFATVSTASFSVQMWNFYKNTKRKGDHIKENNYKKREVTLLHKKIE